MPQAHISIVVPCYNEADALVHLREALVLLMDQLADRYRVQVVLVDDGSRDDTWIRISDIAQIDPRVVGVRLSRNFGHQAALTCGYQVAEGDAVVCMDADLQDPPEVITDLLAEWEKGADIVYAVRARRDGDSWFKRGSAWLFYQLLRLLGAHYVRPNTGDFRLMSRRSIDAFLRLGEHHRFIRGMVGWLGFQTAEVTYHRRPRVAGKTKYPLLKMMSFASDAIVSFSSVPMRLAFTIAGFVGLLVFSYLIYVGYNWWVYDVVRVSGWTSLIMAVMIFGALNLFCLGILGEYVGRLYEQSKGRPLFLVEDTTRVGQADLVASSQMMINNDGHP